MWDDHIFVHRRSAAARGRIRISDLADPHEPAGPPLRAPLDRVRRRRQDWDRFVGAGAAQRSPIARQQQNSYASETAGDRRRTGVCVLWQHWSPCRSGPERLARLDQGHRGVSRACMGGAWPLARAPQRTGCTSSTITDPVVRRGVRQADGRSGLESQPRRGRGLVHAGRVGNELAHRDRDRGG